MSLTSGVLRRCTLTSSLHLCSNALFRGRIVQSILLTLHLWSRLARDGWGDLRVFQPIARLGLTGCSSCRLCLSRRGLFRGRLHLWNCRRFVDDFLVALGEDEAGCAGGGLEGPAGHTGRGGMQAEALGRAVGSGSGRSPLADGLLKPHGGRGCRHGRRLCSRGCW